MHSQEPYRTSLVPPLPALQDIVILYPIKPQEICKIFCDRGCPPPVEPRRRGCRDAMTSISFSIPILNPCKQFCTLSERQIQFVFPPHKGCAYYLIPLHFIAPHFNITYNCKVAPEREEGLCAILADRPKEGTVTDLILSEYSEFSEKKTFTLNVSRGSFLYLLPVLEKKTCER